MLVLFIETYYFVASVVPPGVVPPAPCAVPKSPPRSLPVPAESHAAPVPHASSQAQPTGNEKLLSAASLDSVAPSVAKAGVPAASPVDLSSPLVIGDVLFPLYKVLHINVTVFF
jgi:hypothetical protein